MQILVLGMHRSGTSAVIRLLNMMGAYLGPPERVKGANPENPKGFWENEDVVELDNAVLGAQRCLWNRLSEYDAAKLDDERLATLRRRAKDLVIRLDASRPWAVKDPRMCLLLPFWRPVLELPVCVIVNRNAVEVARSLQNRNRIPLHAGIAMWELHLLEALRGSVGLPRVLLQYEDLLKDPVGSTRALLERLEALGVRKLACPNESEVTAFVDPALRREKASRPDIQEFLNPAQRRLHDALADGSVMDMGEIPPLSQAGSEAMKAYEVTLRAEMRIEQLKGIVGQREQELEEAKKCLGEGEEARKQPEPATQESPTEWGTPSALAEIGAGLKELKVKVSQLERAVAAADARLGEMIARLEAPDRRSD